jgi:hypothetical protein
VEALNKRIEIEFQQSLEMFAHTDGCVPPASCRICPMQSCAERKPAFEQRLEWAFENTTSNQKHGSTYLPKNNKPTNQQ